MASKPAKARPAMPAWVPVVLLLVAVALLVGWIGWRAMSGGGSGPPEGRVKVDINKMRESLREGGFGGHNKR